MFVFWFSKQDAEVKIVRDVKPSEEGKCQSFGQ